MITLIEEYINIMNYRRSRKSLNKYDPLILDLINPRIKLENPERLSFYDQLILRIKNMNEPRFIRKNGNIYDARFYEYARIDDATWSDIKNDKVIPSKKTLLKLIIALRLNHEEAEEMLKQFGKTFETGDIQDQVIEALIELRENYELDVDDVEDILFRYQDMYKDTKYFECIYQTREMRL